MDEHVLKIKRRGDDGYKVISVSKEFPNPPPIQREP